MLGCDKGILFFCFGAFLFWGTRPEVGPLLRPCNLSACMRSAWVIYELIYELIY